MNRNILRVLTLLALCVSAVACIRYTPSRSEIVDDGDKIVSSEKAFFEFEEDQNKRLEGLIAERKEYVMNSSFDDYKVGVGDLLEIKVFDVEELDTKVRVRPSGEISLELIDNVQVAGLSEDEVEKTLEKKLEKFLHVPRVKVFIEEYVSQRVSVIGEVQRAGAYSLKRNDYSLIELISEAGGRTDKASGRIVLIPAAGTGSIHEQQARAKLSSIGDLTTKGNGVEIFFDDLIGSIDKAPLSVPLLPGDTIVVPEAGTVEVDGDVSQPGSYPLSSRMTLLGAIASSGGLTYSADVNNVEVIRELDNGTKAILSVDLEKLAVGEDRDVRVRDGDIVRVPSQAGRYATRQVFEGIRSLFSVGLNAGR